MPTQETDETSEAVESAPAPRAARRPVALANRATLKKLMSKKPREKEVTLNFPGEDEPLTFLFRSIGANEWDALVKQHPPTSSQRADGQPFNTDSFPPALLSRVCAEPDISEEDWNEIWNSPDWNRGEISDLYGEAVTLCTTGFDVPFRGSV
jgi:hypothetical protein